VNVSTLCPNFLFFFKELCPKFLWLIKSLWRKTTLNRLYNFHYLWHRGAPNFDLARHRPRHIREAKFHVKLGSNQLDMSSGEARPGGALPTLFPFNIPFTSYLSPNFISNANLTLVHCAYVCVTTYHPTQIVSPFSNILFIFKYVPYQWIFPPYF